MRTDTDRRKWRFLFSTEGGKSKVCRCYLFAHGGFEKMLLLLLRLLLRRLLSALTGGSLWTLAFPDRALLVGQARGSVVFDGQLPGPMLPAAVARLW